MLRCIILVQAKSSARVFSYVPSCSIVPSAAMSIDIGGMRKPYLDGRSTFDVKELVSKEPFAQFSAWFEQAKSCDKVEEANAMCLATASPTGAPSARMVLLKEFGKSEGFVFYTNSGSRKGKEQNASHRTHLMDCGFDGFCQGEIDYRGIETGDTHKY